jgi:hypothetical protein
MKNIVLRIRRKLQDTIKLNNPNMKWSQYDLIKNPSIKMSPELIRENPDIWNNFIILSIHFRISITASLLFYLRSVNLNTQW